MNAIWKVRDFARALPGGMGESVIVVRAYLDASGQRADPVVVVAGFLGWASNYEIFEEKWLEFLSEFELDHFHATEFWARKSRPYNKWDDTKHQKAKHDVARFYLGSGRRSALASLLT